MDVLTHVLAKIQTAVWGPPTLFLLMGTGLFFTIALGGLQVVKFPRALKCIFEKEDGDGDVSSFATLCTTLAACIGTGSIVGVATALRIGGPGALFWMWVSAILGMTTKYAEGLLAIKYRTTDENGEIAGGPMYYIQNGLGDKFKWLAKLFAFFGAVTALLGSGTFPQVHAITESVSTSFHLPVLLVGAIITIMTAVVTFGGIKSISKVAEFIVPFMALFFVGGSVLILVWNCKVICTGRNCRNCSDLIYDSYENGSCSWCIYKRSRTRKFSDRCRCRKNEFLCKAGSDFYDKCILYNDCCLHDDWSCCYFQWSA